LLRFDQKKIFPLISVKRYFFDFQNNADKLFQGNQHELVKVKVKVKPIKEA